MICLYKWNRRQPFCLFSVPSSQYTWLGSNFPSVINLWTIVLETSLFSGVLCFIWRTLACRGWWLRQFGASGKKIVVNLASEDIHGRGKMSLSSIPLSNWTFKPCSVVLLWQFPCQNIIHSSNTVVSSTLQQSTRPTHVCSWRKTLDKYIIIYSTKHYRQNFLSLTSVYT